MDNTQKPPTVLSFCTGYGGIELGLKRVFGEISVLAHVEIEAYAIANLIAKMENNQMGAAPIWTDVKTLPMGPFLGKVDILTGGYPCQPFSRAGSRKGTEDARHLWPHIRRAIDAIRPGCCFFENVEGHITEGLYDVLNDLGGLGYRSTWGIFSAAEVGLPHHRQRIFILADSGFLGSQRPRKSDNHCNGPQVIPKELKSVFGAAVKGSSGIWKHEGYESKSLLRRGNDGLRNWEDRIRLVGNGVVPQTAELAWQKLWRELNEN